MGLFKDIKNLKAAADEVAPGYKRPSLREGIRQATEAVQNVTQTQQVATELMTNGLDGQATVNFIQATGTTINNFPEIAFKLAVSVGGTAPYEVEHRQVVNPAIIPQIQPGATLMCKVDTSDSSKVWLLV